MSLFPAFASYTQNFDSGSYASRHTLTLYLCFLLSIAFCRYCFVYSISMNSFTGLLRSSVLPPNFRPVAPPSGSPLRRLPPFRLSETGCKSTTFFLSTKLFLKKVFNSRHRHPYKRLCTLHSFSMHLMEGHTRVSLLKGSTIQHMYRVHYSTPYNIDVHKIDFILDLTGTLNVLCLIFIY